MEKIAGLICEDWPNSTASEQAEKMMKLCTIVEFHHIENLNARQKIQLFNSLSGNWGFTMIVVDSAYHLADDLEELQWILPEIYYAGLKLCLIHGDQLVEVKMEKPNDRILNIGVDLDFDWLAGVSA